MDRKALRTIGDLMQPLLPSKYGGGVGGKAAEELPADLTIEQWKVTLINTLKYLKKIGAKENLEISLRWNKFDLSVYNFQDYVKPVMKLTPPSQKDKRTFLMTGTFKDDGPLHLAVKSGEIELFGKEKE